MKVKIFYIWWLCVCVCVCMCVFSHIWLFATPWTVACQAPLSMKFSRQESWSRLLFPSPGDLPDTRLEPMSAALASGLFSTAPSGKPLVTGGECYLLELVVLFIFISTCIDYVWKYIQEVYKDCCRWGRRFENQGTYF